MRMSSSKHSQPIGAHTEPVELSIPQGVLLGETIPVEKNNSQSAPQAISAFKGIPYAKPPVGSLRWQPAQPAGPWSGVRQATACAASPMQLSNTDKEAFFYQPPLSISEDCLYLNVWTPSDLRSMAAHQGKKPFPVMVWLYGGGLLSGSSSLPVYDGTELAAKGVVVISINYRVGVFGYFSHPALTRESPYQASGNYGTTDQIQALKWIQENASGFGGDEENITIFGESAGALSVSHLMASPLAQGLFHKAIMQSAYLPPMPSLSKPVYSMFSAEEYGLKFSSACGVPHEGDKGLQALREMSAEKLLDHSAGFEFDKAVVDNWVFPEQVFEIFEQKKQHDVPLLAGFNRDEGSYFPRCQIVKEPEDATSYKEIIRERYGKLSSDYLNVYSEKDLYYAAIAPMGDGLYGWGTQKLARSMDGLSSDTYIYYFEHSSAWAQQQKLGAFHTSEIPYVFNNIKHGFNFCQQCPDLSKSDIDLALADRISNYWVAFAANGQPTVTDQPVWPPFSCDTQSYMSFDRGEAVPRQSLMPETFALHEAIVNHRRQRQLDWTYKNIGLLAPVLFED